MAIVVVVREPSVTVATFAVIAVMAVAAVT
jgi:hypothetical protein